MYFLCATVSHLFLSNVITKRTIHLAIINNHLYSAIMRVAIILLLSLLGVEADTKAAQNENILLSKVKYLTLRDGQFTKARRVSPVPQVRKFSERFVLALILD